MAKSRSTAKPITFSNVFGAATVQQEMLLFVVVSTMDVVMTHRLLSYSEVFVESNPVARYFLGGWGVTGMIYFKMAMVAVVCVLSQMIAQHRPKAARWLLLWATAVVAVVVVYSLLLFVQHRGTVEEELTVMGSIRSIRLAA